MATVAQELMTLEQYALLPDNGKSTELVEGKVVTLNQPTPRHGEICMKIGWLLMTHVKKQQLGHVVCNDAAIVTRRDVDSVRGADIAFYSRAQNPTAQLPNGYLSIVPELVFEVRSASDRWTEILTKVAEYLRAGVTMVCVADPDPEIVHIYRDDMPVEVLTKDQEFSLPELLPDFRVPVREFFE